MTRVGFLASVAMLLLVPSVASPAGVWAELASMPTRQSLADVRDGGGLAVMSGTGLIYAIKGNRTGDFYSYNPGTGAWTILTMVPEGPAWKQVKTGGCIATDGSRNVYVVKGNNTLEYYRFSADSFLWRRVQDVPLGTTGKKVKAGDIVTAPVNGGAHIYFLKGVASEFYRYSTIDTVWHRLPPPSTQRGKWNKGSFLVYDGDHTIYAHKAKYHELWAYNTRTDSWGLTALPGMPFVGRTGRSTKTKDGSCGVFYNGGLYALKGSNTQEFWKYDTATRAWSELETLPQWGSTGKRKRVKAGGDMVAIGNVFYALKGNKCRELWSYMTADTAYGLQPTANGQEQTGAVTFGNRHSQFVISPNPLTGGFATVSFTRPLDHLTTRPLLLTVFDVSGRSIQSAICNLKSEMTLDVRHVPAGVYLLRLEADGLSARQKLVVQREHRKL